MKNFSDEDLIGWLLDALEPAEADQVGKALETDAQLRDRVAELKKQLAVLPERFTEVDPPENLTDKTLNTIGIVDASLEGRGKVTSPLSSTEQQLVTVNSRQWQQHFEGAVRSRQWSAMDLIIGGLVCFVVATILLPSIANSRFESNLLHCQNNLRTTGQYMASLADLSEGRLQIPAETDRLQASYFVQRMLDAGLTRDAQDFICPGDPGREETAQIYRQAWEPALVFGSDVGISQQLLPGRAIPTPTGVTSEMITTSDAVASEVDFRSVPGNLQAWKESQNEVWVRCNLLRQAEASSGSYGFPAPLIVSPQLAIVRIPGGSHDVLSADAACFDNPGYRSRNHGGRGQNVLLGDLAVDYIHETACLPTGDHIYTNNQGRVQPGISPGDNLIYRGVIQDQRLERTR